MGSQIFRLYVAQKCYGHRPKNIDTNIYVGESHIRCARPTGHVHVWASRSMSVASTPFIHKSDVNFFGK